MSKNIRTWWNEVVLRNVYDTKKAFISIILFYLLYSYLVAQILTFISWPACTIRYLLDYEACDPKGRLTNRKILSKYNKSSISQFQRTTCMKNFQTNCTFVVIGEFQRNNLFFYQKIRQLIICVMFVWVIR